MLFRSRAETLAGAVVFDVRIRGFDDLDGHWHNDTEEQRAERHTRYAGTIGPAAFKPHTDALTDARMIGWDQYASSTGHGYSSIPPVKRQDSVSERLALFSGVAPQHYGTWFPEPKIPWSNYPPTYPPYTMHRALCENGDSSLVAVIANLRTLLHLMAHNNPPAPSWVNPTSGKITVAPKEGI